MPSVMYVRDTSNAKNVILEVDGSNQLSVKDIFSQSSLASMDSKIALESHQVSHNTKLDTGNTSLASIDTKLSSQGTAAKQADIESAVNAVNTTLAGTLTVSSSLPRRTQGSLAASALKSAGDLTASVNGTNFRTAAIFGSSSSNSAQIRVHISHDNTNFYEDHQNMFFANATNGHIAGNFQLNAPYFKIEFVDAATYTLEYACVD